MGKEENVHLGGPPTLTPVVIDCSRLTDWDAFHNEFARVFGFPEWYGRNNNAWIDLMTYADEPGQIGLEVPQGAMIELKLSGVGRLRSDAPDIHDFLLDGSAIVNGRRRPQPPLLVVSYVK